MEVIVTSKEALQELIRDCVAAELSALQSGTQSPQGKELLSIEEVADLTGFAKSTIYNLVSTKGIPSYKKQGRLFFIRSEVMDWIRQGDTPAILIDLTQPKHHSTTTKKAQ